MDEDLEHEEVMIRVMFNTTFVQSKSLLLDHEDIDALWKTRDQFAEHFKAEVLFSDFDTGSNTITEPIVVDDDRSGGVSFRQKRSIANPKWNGHRDPDVHTVPITSTLEDGSHKSALEFSNPETEATSRFPLSSSDF